MNDQQLKIKLQDRIDKAYETGNKVNALIQKTWHWSIKNAIGIGGILIAILWFVGGMLDFMHKRNVKNG
jgi:hypothetical protein